MAHRRIQDVKKKYCLANLPAKSERTLATTLKARWVCEQANQQMKEESGGAHRPGRKLIPTRRVLEKVLWILNTGAQWHMLPQSYPNYKTVHRRFQDEILRRVLTDVANELRDRGAR